MCFYGTLIFLSRIMNPKFGKENVCFWDGTGPWWLERGEHQNEVNGEGMIQNDSLNEWVESGLILPQTHSITLLNTLTHRCKMHNMWWVTNKLNETNSRKKKTSQNARCLAQYTQRQTHYPALKFKKRCGHTGEVQMYSKNHTNYTQTHTSQQYSCRQITFRQCCQWFCPET